MMGLSKFVEDNQGKGDTVERREGDNISYQTSWRCHERFGMGRAVGSPRRIILVMVNKMG